MAYFGTLAPYIAPQGGPNGVNHISMYLGYHNIEIKTRDILKLNFGIWNIAGSKPDSVLKSSGNKLNANRFRTPKKCGLNKKWKLKWKSKVEILYK